MSAALMKLCEGESYATGFGASWVLGEDSWGDLRVPSLRMRLKNGEPWWKRHYNPRRRPWHLFFAVWTLVKRGVAYLDV